MDKRLPVLMTASIDTRGMAGADFDALCREKMYLESVGFYMKELLAKDKERRIIVVENSGWGIDSFKAKMGKLPEGQIEFISLDPNDFDVSKGKGYSELILINQALEKSKTLRDAGAFMKVTGRYPVYNLPDYMHGAERVINAGGKFYGDIKDRKMLGFARLRMTF